MVVELELWHLISVLIAFFGCIFGFGKVLLSQIDKRLDQRFDGAQVLLNERFLAQERARTEAQTRMERELVELDRQLRQTAERLPSEYVRREDWIRFTARMDSMVDDINRKVGRLEGEAQRTGNLLQVVHDHLLNEK